MTQEVKTKQEEIREGIWEFILEIRQYLCNTEFAPEPFTKPVDLEVLREMGKTQLKKMGSQGVVIKVDGELSEEVIGKTIAEVNAQVVVAEAGYVAVEPLVEA